MALRGLVPLEGLRVSRNLSRQHKYVLWQIAFAIGSLSIIESKLSKVQSHTQMPKTQHLKFPIPEALSHGVPQSIAGARCLAELDQYWGIGARVFGEQSVASVFNRLRHRNARSLQLFHIGDASRLVVGLSQEWAGANQDACAAEYRKK